MSRENILNLFENAVAFSQKYSSQRLAERPLFTLSRSLFFRFYHLLSAKKALKMRGRTFWGEKMQLTIPDGASIFQWGFITGPEAELTRFIIRNLKPSEVFIDVGAHFGFYSLLASLLVGERGSVHSFEPTPTTFSILAKNAASKKNIIINQKAIWEKEEFINFTDFGCLFGSYNTTMVNTVIQEVNENPYKQTIKVKATTLDGYVNKKRFTPRFIKLDVEAAELLALRGMRRLLRNGKPLVSVEFWGREHWTEKNDKVFNLMKQLGYRPHRLVNGELVLYQEEKDFIYTNLIFKKNQNLL